MKYQTHTQQCHHKISVLKRYKQFISLWGCSVWFVCTRGVYRVRYTDGRDLIQGRQGKVAQKTWHPVTTAIAMAYICTERIAPTLLWGRHCTPLYSWPGTSSIGLLAPILWEPLISRVSSALTLYTDERCLSFWKTIRIKMTTVVIPSRVDTTEREGERWSINWRLPTGNREVYQSCIVLYYSVMHTCC